MTGTLRRSLEELYRASGQEMPPLCNVLVQIDSPPVRVSQQGGRWQLQVKSMAATAQAFVCVHDDPAATGLRLGYTKTSESLLAMFREDPQRRLFVPGEVALVQAEPRRSADGKLFLNVQTILLLRPFQTFGRTLVDFESRCSRKSYLSATKGVSPKRRGDFHVGHVGGQVAHDVFSYLAEGGSGRGGSAEEVLGAALGIETIGSLVFLGLKSLKEMETALRPGLDVQEVVARSGSLRQLLQSDQWAPESEVLNNGVIVAPDLLGRNQVAELKYIKPNSEYADPDRHRVQVQAYLAWAMVEYGLPEVCSHWKGLLVQLHPQVEESARVQTVQAQPHLIGERLLNRHRLLALTNGAWLPAPSPEECTRCEFSDYASRAESSLVPPACTFHCQMERGWECYSPGRPCPLIDKCDQYDRFVEFERADQFNRLRGDLLDEEEERAAIAQVVEVLTGREGGEATGLVLGELKVLEHKRGALKLELPLRLCVLDFAHRDEVFELLHEGRPTGLVRMYKRKGRDHMVLSEVHATGRLLAAGTRVALRAVPEWRLGPRDQLRYLDLVQRLNEMPMSLRTGLRRDKVPAREEHRSLEQISPEAKLVLIDAPGRATLRDTVQKVLDRMCSRGTERILVVDAIEGLTTSAQIADLSDLSLSEEFGEGTQGAQERLSALVERIKNKRIWSVPREQLFGPRLSAVVEASQPFSDILVIGAETFPLLAVNRCLALGKRLTLIGQATAGGPRAESARARQSELYQNTLRFLIEAGTSVFPADIERVEIVRLPTVHGCAGLDRIFKLQGITHATRLETHVCSAPGTGEPGDGANVAGGHEIELTRFVPLSPQQVQPRHIIVEVLPSTERSSVRHLKELLKGITARSIERMSITTRGHLDTALLGERVRIVDVTQVTIADGPNAEHRVSIRVPHDRFPFIQERLLTNRPEADAVIAFAQQHPQRQFQVTSPFFAQCLLVSRLAAEKGLGNLTVAPLDHLGWKRHIGDRGLLVTTVIQKANPDYPYPMNDLGRLMELFVGDYAEVHLFSTQEALNHHPILTRLTRPKL